MKHRTGRHSPIATAAAVLAYLGTLALTVVLPLIVLGGIA